MSLWKINELIPGMYDFNMRRSFLELLTLLYISHTEHKNNVDDGFTKDVRTFLISYFPLALDQSIAGVSAIIISNEFCRRVIWGE